MSPFVYQPMLINASDGDPVTTSTAPPLQKEREALLLMDAYERCVSTQHKRRTRLGRGTCAAIATHFTDTHPPRRAALMGKRGRHRRRSRPTTLSSSLPSQMALGVPSALGIPRDRRYTHLTHTHGRTRSDPAGETDWRLAARCE